MSIVLDFPQRPTPVERGPILARLCAMDDTVEIALEQLAAGRRPADVIADAFRAGTAYATREHTGHDDPQAATALDAIDELAARRTQREGSDAS